MRWCYEIGEEDNFQRAYITLSMPYLQFKLVISTIIRSKGEASK
jgi:hypothetical protein